MTTTFFIPDTSPIFTYSSGWTSAYHPKGDGFDETFHQTTSGSETISFNLTASSLHFSTPLNDANGAICDVQYRVDQSAWTDGCDVQDMSKGWHGVDIRPKGGVGMQFLGVRGELRLGDGPKSRNVTIDNLSSQFTYSASPSAWTLINSAGPLGEVQNQTAANAFGNKGAFFGQSLGMSTAEGAKAELRFKGEAVYLYGMSGPEMGVGEMMLDGQVMPRVNMTLPWRSYSSLLFMAGALDTTIEHTLSFTNTIAGRTALVDYAIVTSPSVDKPLGLIIGAAAGGAVAILLLCAALHFCISRRRRSRKATSSRRSLPSSGHGSAATYSDGPESIDEWRKQSGGAGSPISPVSITFSNASEGSRSTTQLVNLHPTPPPEYAGSEYPDYIPYNGPVEPRPPVPALVFPDGQRAESPSATSLMLRRGDSVSSLAPSTVAGTGRPGLSSPASGSARSPYSTPTSSTNPTSSSAYSTLARPSGPARTGSRETVSTLDVPLTAIDQYSRREQGKAPGSSTDLRLSETDLFSLPATTPARPWNSRDSMAAPSSAGYSEAASVRNATISTATASKVDGSRSVARLLPTRSGMPLLSTIDGSSPSSTATIMSRGSPPPIRADDMQPRHPGRTPLHLPHIVSTGRFSNLYASYGGTPTPTDPSSAQSHSSTARHIPSAIPSSAALPTSYSTSPSLRRGPSIKSVKTARSFFSGLLGTGDAPAVPRYHDSMSRPDSDLFGDSISMRRRPSVGEGALYGQPGQMPQRGDGGSGVGRGGARHAPQPLRLVDGVGNGGPKNIIIELDPNSPMTVASRRGSEQPFW